MTNPFSARFLLPLFVLCTVCLHPLSGAAVSTSLDFDSGAAELTDNFCQLNDSAVAGVTWSATAGVKGTGGLTVNSTVDNALYPRKPETPGWQEGAVSLSPADILDGKFTPHKMDNKSQRNRR